MKNLLCPLFILCLSFTMFGQSFSLVDSVGKFQNASAFYINSAGFIFVSDAGTNEIYKLDTLGRELKEAGGYGWDEGSFDDPADVFATPLTVYVCDKNNHRVERFDKDLNYISQLYTKGSDDNAEDYGYPLSCTVSPQGDLYILDSENTRIIKFDLFGNFKLNFGGYDSGEYALNKPKKLAISQSNSIYVLDENDIVLFDQYGNGIAVYNTNENFTGMNIIYNLMTVNTKSNIYFSNLSEEGFVLNKLQLSGRTNNEVYVSSLIFNGKLYVLTPENILIFKAENL